MQPHSLTDDQLNAIATAHVGDYLGFEWTQEYVEGDGDEPAYYRVQTKNGLTVATLPDWAGPIALFLPEAHDAVPALVAEVIRSRATLASISAKLDQFPLLKDETQASDYDLGRNDLAESIRNRLNPPDVLAQPPSTPNLAEWANDMADDNLEPSSDAITVDGDGKPIARIHVAFRTDMSDRARSGFMLGLGQALADGF